MAPGYWGNPDGIMDFCEPNYAVTYYVAEFFNTMSSIPFCVLGVLGLVLTHKFATTEFRFKLCFLSMLLMGFGTILFHASLLFKYQLLDEMPMLFWTANWLYCALTLELPPGETDWRLALVLVAVTATEVVFYIVLEVYGIFLVGFSANVVIGTFVMVHRYRHLLGRLVPYGLLAYYGAACCWLLDMSFCDRVQNLQLHSFWHLGAAYGQYLATGTILCARASFLKKRCQIHLWRLSLRWKAICIDIPVAHYCVFTELKNA